MNKRQSVFGILLVTLVALVGPKASVASASIVALASHSTIVSTSSAKWSVAAISSIAAPVVNPGVALNFTPSDKKGTFFYLYNFGNVSTTSAEITQTITGTGSVTISMCTGALWNGASGNCGIGGTETTLMVTTNANSPQVLSSASFALPISSSMQLKAVASTPSISSNISVKISRSMVRSALITNS
ncbi:unannotated protein [freshwater metagenome]|uniref:Unannotated protein n=1 Tax=freshwater metagenome TaxID=449393 RepID=A0A6J7XUV8_9ZZZZ|nr:hypothetical protein [Actinomycetota bacterium]